LDKEAIKGALRYWRYLLEGSAGTEIGMERYDTYCADGG
jgi:hypothetical protein